jgi:carboxylesterase
MKKTTLLALVIPLGLAGFVVMRVPSFQSVPQPAISFDQALEKFQDLRVSESDLPLRDDGGSLLLHHGRKTERAFVLLHGLTNCPAQFALLAQILHASGSNVVVPRARLAGFSDRLNDEQGLQTGQDLVDQAATGLDIGAGLGDHVSLVGLSGSAVAVAWIAQNRTGIDDAVLISPFFSLHGAPVPLIDGIAAVLSRIPNFYLWWDSENKENLAGPDHAYPRFGTHCMAGTLQLSRNFRAHIAARPLLAKRVVFLTTATDQGANNPLTHSIAAQLAARKESHILVHEFPAALALPHDMIDPAQPGANTTLAYAKILDLLNVKTPESPG